MACVLMGPRTWNLTRDPEGHRDYRIVHRVVGTTSDGPFQALLTPGLPVPGSVWSFFGDTDPWAWCRADAEVTPVVSDGEKGNFFDVEQVFSTRADGPGDAPARCQDTPVEDPLLEPQRVRGSFNRFSKEAEYDRFFRPILASSHEKIRGKPVEFDDSRPVVIIEQNVADLQLTLLAQLMNRVNDAPLWGMPERCVKLSSVTWEKRYYAQCSVYYTRTLEFEAEEETFDRFVLDEGTKVLNGKWHPETGGWQLIDINGQPPDPDNPSHFIRFTDRNGNPSRVLLDGRGLPSDVSVIRSGGASGHGGDAGSILVQYYQEGNFFLLGIPAVLG